MADETSPPGTLLQRLLAPRHHFVLVPLLSVLAALAICFVAIWLTGRDPVAGYLKMFDGGLGSLRSLGDSSMKASVLALTGLSVAVAFSVGLFNIGAEGQLVAGAIAAAWVGQAVSPGSAWIHLPLALLAAVAAGAAWGLVPAWLKVRRGVHEVISTIMLNWIAIHLVESWLVVGPLAARSAQGHSLPGTPQIAPTAELPRFLGPRSELGLGLVLAVVAALVVWFLLRRTWVGFELRAVGASPEAARYAGIGVAKRTYLAMGLAGACAGLAGAVLILGIHRQYPATFHGGYGFDGIAISLIGGNHPLGTLVAAAFFGVIRAGGTKLQLLQIHRTFPELIQGLALLFIAGQMITRHLLTRLSRPRPAARPGGEVAPDA
jgi:simple sugar transport system permease protein